MKTVTNLTLQSYPFESQNPDGTLRFNWLVPQQAIVMADRRITPYLTALADAGVVTILDTSDSITEGYD